MNVEIIREGRFVALEARDGGALVFRAGAAGLTDEAARAVLLREYEGWLHANA
jgi:hypothetical protein